LQLVTTAFDGNARLWTLEVDRPATGGAGFRYLRERVRSAAVTEFPAGVLDGGAIDAVRYAAFANSSDQLVTTTKSGRIAIWALSGERRCGLDLGGQGSPAALLPVAGFSADDQQLFSAQTGVGAQLWDLSVCAAASSADAPALRCVAPGCRQFALDGEISAALSQPLASPGPWRPVVGFADGRIAVLNPKDPANPVCSSAQRHAGSVVDVSYSPNHDALLTASADGTAALWDPNSCQRLRVYGGKAGEFGHEQSLYSARFSPDGERIVTASQDRTALLWRRDGTPLKRLVGHLDRVYHASFSPDGRWVLTASRDGSARLWDSAAADSTLSAVVILEGNGSGISSAAFSPDGRYVASGYWEPGADLWDVLIGDAEDGFKLTMPDYARRFVELNRLQQWKVKSVPRELPWWEEISRAVWGQSP
jgi:WD40 repeat protein